MESNWDTLSREQQVDLLMADKTYDQVFFSEVLEWYERHCNEKGFRNPLDNKLVGSSPKSLDGGELHHLIAMRVMLQKDLKRLGLTMTDYLNSETKFSYHYKDVWEAITILLGEQDLPQNDKTCPTSYTVLAHWGLIGKDKDKINVLSNNRKSKYKGYWYITNKGILFMYNKIKLPKSLVTKGGRKTLSGEEIYYKDCSIITYEQRQKYRTTYF